MTDEKKRKTWLAFMKEFTARFKEQLVREGIKVTVHDHGFSKNGIPLGFIDFPEKYRKTVEAAYTKLHGQIFRQYADEYKDVVER